jgi:hypothetical protein
VTTLIDRSLRGHRARAYLTQLATCLNRAPGVGPGPRGFLTCRDYSRSPWSGG